MARKLVLEVLEEAAEIHLQDKREEFLKQYMCPAIEIIFGMVFNDNITFPDYSEVKYKPNPGKVGCTDSNLNKEAKKLYIYTDQYEKIPLERKKAKLIQLLQAIHKDEAEFLMEYLLKKQLPWRKLPKNFVEKKYPHVLEESFVNRG